MSSSINDQIADLEAALELAKLIQAKYPSAYPHQVGKFLAWVSPDISSEDITDFVLITGESCPYLWAFHALDGSSNARVYAPNPVPLSFVVSEMKAPMLECVKKHLGKV